MTPKKLFDYLDGQLPGPEREEIERRIAIDPALQRELAIARKLHESMPGSREVIGSLDEASGSTQRGAILARRVIIAFAALVFLNVALGIWFITQKETRSPGASRSDVGMRQQVERSLERAATSALPTPNLEADEIRIHTSAAQQETITYKIIESAKQSGGSAAKALADESGIIVLVDIPRNREAEFRKKLVAFGAPPSTTGNSPRSGTVKERSFLQVHVTKVADAKQP